MRSNILWFIGLTLLVTVAPAFADTIEYCGTSTGGSSCATTAPSNGFLFKSDLSTSPTDKFTLTLTVTNDTGAKAYLNDFTISLLGGGKGSSVNVTSDNLSSYTGWTELDNAKTTNTNGQPAGCTSQTGFGGWLCATADKAGDSILLAANGGTVTFTFSGTYTGAITTPFYLIADAGTSNTTGNNKAFTIGDSMDTQAPTSPVPEPSSLFLLGSGLLAAAVTMRKTLSA